MPNVLPIVWVRIEKAPFFWVSCTYMTCSYSLIAWWKESRPLWCNSNPIGVTRGCRWCSNSTNICNLSRNSMGILGVLVITRWLIDYTMFVVTRQCMTRWGMWNRPIMARISLPEQPVSSRLLVNHNNVKIHKNEKKKKTKNCVYSSPMRVGEL